MQMKAKFLDKVGAIGAVFSLIAAAGCPACFPLLGIIGATFGLGFLRPYEGILMHVFQGFVFLSLIGNVIAYLSHRKIYALLIGVISPLMIFFAFYVYFDYRIIYAGMLGLLVTAVVNYIERRKCKRCKAN